MLISTKTLKNTFILLLAVLLIVAAVLYVSRKKTNENNPHETVQQIYGGLTQNTYIEKGALIGAGRTEESNSEPIFSASAACAGVVTGQAINLQLPIIMYHALLTDENRSGKYVIAPDTLKEDLAWLIENGYKTVSVRQIYGYLSGVGELPEKPVILSFDDGYYNFYLYAYPLLKEQDCKFVLSLIVKMTEFYSLPDSPNQVAAFSHVNFTQLNEMLESGLCEIGNHTYDLHSFNKDRNGILPMYAESASDYSAAVGGDIQKAQMLISENTGQAAYIFTYPFGAYSNEAGKLVDSYGFIAGFSCEEGTNLLHGTEDLKLLKRFNRPFGLESAEFFKEKGM